MSLQPRVSILPGDVARTTSESFQAFKGRLRSKPWARFLYYRLMYALPSMAGIRRRGLAIPRRPLVLFMPEPPPRYSTMYKICKMNQYRFTTRPTTKPDIVVRWEDTTVGRPVDPRPEWIGSARLVNFCCLDISKRRLDEVHREIFGYGVNVDPLTYVGPGVIKSDLNGLHDGQVATFPISHIEDGIVYQRLIRNEVEGGMVGDVRVPIFNDTIPFVWRRYHPEDARFGRGGPTLTFFASTDEYLSPHEQELILALARRIGLDYGEFDALRDAEDGRIYVVDANNTPSSPPSYEHEADRRKSETMLADAFERAFAS
jgi:hypothetical protein